MFGKFFVMLVTLILGGAVTALTGDNHIGGAETLNIVLIALGAISTGLVPNLTGGVAKYTKALVAGFFAVGTLAVNLIADGVTISEWLQMTIAFLGALGVVFPAAPQFSLAAAYRSRTTPIESPVTDY